jgi:hypothetical protein
MALKFIDLRKVILKFKNFGRGKIFLKPKRGLRRYLS